MALPKTMKAIQIKAFDAPYSASDIPVPQPKPYQLLVQIKASGFCHSDLAVLDPASNSPLPLVGSHEPAGVVVEVGSEAEGFAVGDRVGCLSFENVCGQCPDCRAGRPIFCDKPGLKGFNTDGGWSEYMVADARFTVKLPDSLDFPTAACLMCAGVTVYAGIKKADVPSGGSIAIIGIGGLGHIGTQIAKAMGYRVVAVDVKQSSLDLAESHALKPDLSILATEAVGDAVQRISRAIPGDCAGVDATILATDAAPAIRFAADMTRKHGTLVLLGQPAAGVTLTSHDLIFRDLRLVGSILADRETAQELVQLVAEHGVQVKTTEWEVGDAEAMRQEYLAGRSEGKNVIVFR